MDTIYLKISIPKNATTCDEIREEGLFFENIADALSLERGNIEEIAWDNYEKIVGEIVDKFE